MVGTFQTVQPGIKRLEEENLFLFRLIKHFQSVNNSTFRYGWILVQSDWNKGGGGSEVLFEQRTDWIEHWWHAHQPLVEVSLCHTAWFLLLVGSVFVFSILCISSQGIIMPRSSTPATGKFLTQAIPRLTAHTNGIWTPMEAKRGGAGWYNCGFVVVFCVFVSVTCF